MVSTEISIYNSNTNNLPVIVIVYTTFIVRECDLMEKITKRNIFKASLLFIKNIFNINNLKLLSLQITKTFFKYFIYMLTDHYCCLNIFCKIL